MGYSTEFTGRFNLNKPLTPELAGYLNKFADTRRMKRNVTLTAKFPDPVRTLAGFPIGEEGGYFVGAEGFMGQGSTADILNYNLPPSGQPSLWCKWAPTKDLQGIEWNGAEKFYHYVQWLDYLINHFLAPNGYVLNGEVEYQGEDPTDHGYLIVKNNKVTEE